ncbi:MAG: helix-turn-helix domain-containing protein [Anaerolineales bacterium]|nr:helix-turn-helix domain-containing protein [Anaerolineales bacterium]
MSSQTSPIILNNLISLKEAAECSGYSPQYLRRLMRTGKLTGVKLGQQWLIEMESFDVGSTIERVNFNKSRNESW